MEKDKGKFSKLSPPKGKLLLSSLEDEEMEPSPSPEKPIPMALSPPKELGIDQKIAPYDKMIYMWNHKSNKNMLGVKFILTELAEKGVSNESDLAKYIVKIMELCNQVFFVKGENLDALQKFCQTLSAESKQKIFTELIPCIASFALQVELMFPDGTVPFLTMNKQNVIKFSRREVACILANMFLSAIPKVGKEYDIGEYRFYGMMCRDMAFCSFAINEKLPFILTYFDSIMKQEPEGVITISRNSMSLEERKEWTLEKWLSSTKPLNQMELKTKTRIEEMHDLIQVDFANMYVGGGIDNTCLQEQILFVIYPELFVTCLVCEKMLDHEAVIITGVQQFATYKGYSETFKFAGPISDPLSTKQDSLGRIPRQILALDALPLSKKYDQIKQFSPEYTLRELNKAYIGFKGDFQCDPLDNRGISTGKWGCGVFYGCTEYKWLIQWIAASETGRKMVFCSFDAVGLEEFMDLLIKLKDIKVGNLTKLTLEIGQEVSKEIIEKNADNYGLLVKNALKKRLGQ